MKREKKDSVLTKHKKWLQELQRTKELIEQENIQKLKLKEESAKRLEEAAKSGKLVFLPKSIDSLGINQTDSKPETDSITANTLIPFNSSAESKEKSKSDGLPIIADSKHPKLKAVKPAWAKLPHNSDDDSDIELDDELNELLEFAEKIDYDKCINDIEVQLMMDQMKKRIGELENEISVDEKRDADSKDTLDKRDKLALMVSHSVDTVCKYNDRLSQLSVEQLDGVVGT